MKILIIRHADAEEPARGKTDAARRLTASGRDAMRRAAEKLGRLAPRVDVLATSPYVRARETAQIVAPALGARSITVQPLLVPHSDTQRLLEWLQTQPAAAGVALVGHEPLLSAFARMLIGGAADAPLVLKKGACCLIEFAGLPVAGGGTLHWLRQPEHLSDSAG